jgi:hypothetical protein
MPKLKKSAKKSTKVARMSEEMEKFKHGTLHSGSKKGPKVKSRAQAVAIGLSESGQSNRDKNTSVRGRKRIGKVKRSSRHYGHASKGTKKKSYKR